ncbi:MAG: hypothetical protein DRJ40_03645 [Thermoprotei archaeon]|nr:MAG: hypothetical protein DRJ40_03645 [Thermoprotei archaeon]
MTRLLVLTLGFEEKFAFRMLTRHGLDRGDRILILTGRAVERTVKAIETIKEFVKKYFPGEIDVEFYEVDLSNFIEAVRRIRDVLSRYIPSYDKVIINLTGGMRVLILATFTALLLLSVNLGERITHIEVEFEDGTYLVKIPQNLPRMLLNVRSLTRERIELLRAIQELGEVTVKDLAKVLGKDESTIRRQIYELEKLELVEVTKTRPTKIKVTELGRLLI